MLDRYPDPELPETVEIFKLESYGLALSRFHDSQAEIESALNIYVVRFIRGNDNRTVLLYAVPATGALPKVLPWLDTRLYPGESQLNLGCCVIGSLLFDLNESPHLLLGGATGSGKTVLLLCLLHQALQKGASVIIADFKGVDFGQYWQERCQVIFDEESLVQTLHELIDTLAERKRLFQACDCRNIQDYNRQAAEPLQRIIFACDEVSELLDKTGASKERKEILLQIEGALATIARQGRAFGIHLFLATQRPDANILPGQIKNNIPYRVCGRVDQVLSQIILDSTDAADQIPANAQGLFLNQDGTLFRGYYFQEPEASRERAPSNQEDEVLSFREVPFQMDDPL